MSLHQREELVGEIGLHGGFVAGGAQETQPGLLFVPEGAELPDAVGALVAAFAREEGEARGGGVLLAGGGAGGPSGGALRADG